MTGLLPKQYCLIGEKTCLTATLETLMQSPLPRTYYVIIRPEDEKSYEDAIAPLKVSERARLAPPIYGGLRRQDSVRAGLTRLAAHESPPQYVLIHDSARPFLSRSLLERSLRSGMDYGAAAPTLPVAETIVELYPSNHIERFLNRPLLRILQTPQVFPFDQIWEAHQKAHHTSSQEFTDDMSLVHWVGYPIYFFEGEETNIKITYDKDLTKRIPECQN